MTSTEPVASFEESTAESQELSAPSVELSTPSVELSTSTEESTSSSPAPLAYEHTFPEGHLDFDAIKVVNRLERFGHVAYFVGGCVRDLLLGIRPKDYDLVTSATPRQVKKLFRNSRVIGRRFKLVHVVFGGKVIELSTFRRTADNDEDNEQPNHDLPNSTHPNSENDSSKDKSLLIHSDNDFGTAQEDAIRRDFTINALYYSQERKQLIDYVGGIEDLKARKLKTIGDPETRFREDPVRMIRAIKLLVKLNLNVDDGLIDKIKEFHHKLLKSSSPRILEEMYKLLECGASSEIFEKLYELGLFETMLKPLQKKLEECHDGVAPLVKTLSKLDSIMDDGKTPSKALSLASFLLPVVESIFTNDCLCEEQVTDQTTEGEETFDNGPTQDESADNTVARKSSSNGPFLHLSIESISDFLHDTHALQSVARRDKEDAVRLIGDLNILRRNVEAEIQSFIRKPSFADTFRLFKIGSLSTEKFSAELEKLEELTKDFDFNPSKPEYRKHRGKPRRFVRPRTRQ
jgi:poly(A) polymerase